MKMLVGCTVFAAAVLFGLAAQASEAVVKGCEGLSAAIKSEFSVPYKPVKGRLSVSCVKDVSVTLKTMHFFVASAFYHDDTLLRGEAIKKLSAYRCPSKESCGELEKLVETHSKVTVQARPEAWVELEALVSELKNSLRAKAAE